MPVLAGVALVANIGMGAYQMSQQSGIAGQESSMAGVIFGEQQGFEKQLEKLIADPSSIAQNPAYQFALGQGENAISAGGLAKFGGQGGGTGLALEQYAAGYASQELGQQEQLLASLSGLQTASSPAQLLSGASQANSTAFNMTGQLGGALGAYLGGGGYGAGGTGTAGWFGSGTPGAISGGSGTGGSNMGTGLAGYGNAGTFTWTDPYPYPN